MKEKIRQMPYMTLKERIYAEVFYGHPNVKLTKNQVEQEMQNFSERMVISPNDMKLCIAHCIYNEEDMLLKVLENDLIINDIDLIHILDGSWNHFEGEAKSTDKTKEIVKEFTKKCADIGIKVIFEGHPKGEKWNSESEKRNYQLDRIREYCGDVPNYILIKDGDEYFHITTGAKTIWMKSDLSIMYTEKTNVGVMWCYPYYSHMRMSSPRLFPDNTKFHYYTEKSMCIHDGECNVLCDYNPSINKTDDTRTFVLTSMVIINHLHQRSDDRKAKKIEFVKHLESQLDTTAECTYGKKV